MGRCTAACMLAGSRWRLIMPGGRENDTIIENAWIFKVLWGEWHPSTDLSGDVMLDEREMYAVDLAPTVPKGGVRPNIELLFDKDKLSLRDNSSTDRLHAYSMKKGVSNVVLAIDGLRRGLGFETHEVRWYPDKEIIPPGARERNYYCAIYCFMGDRNQKDELEGSTGLQSEEMIKSGWVFFEEVLPDYRYPLTEPENGDIPLPPTKTFAILNGRYGALRGSNRELYFFEDVDPDFKESVMEKFEFKPGEEVPVRGMRLNKEGHDVTLYLNRG